MKTIHIASEYEPMHRVGTAFANIIIWALILSLALGEIGGVEFAVSFVVINFLGNIIRLTARVEKEKL